MTDPRTDDVTDWSQYEAIVGKRWNYYQPRFERFARGGWLSWNWSAFIATLAWLRYRRLHAWSWAYAFVSTPFMLAYLMLRAAGDSCEHALDPAPGEATFVVLVSILALGWILPPLVCDRLYYDRVRAAVSGGATIAGTSGIAGALVLQTFILVGTAITVPSYGSYRYRSIVSEGMALASSAREPLAGYIESHGGKLPSRIGEVTGTTTANGRLELQPDGTIKSIFGAGAKKLAGRSISMVPTIKDGRVVEWRCRSDDLPGRCLPASCRP